MYLGSSPPCDSLFTLGALWPPGEPEEDEEETEEPKVCAPKQAKSDWTHTWLEEGGAPALAEDKAQGLLSQVFWSSQASFLILFWCFVFSILASDHVLELSGLSNFFRVCNNCSELISSGKRQTVCSLRPMAWMPKAFSR